MMRQTVSALVLALASVFPASASASLAVALVTPQRIIVASDSRTWDSRCDCAGADQARKVDIRGDLAFVMTGYASLWASWARTATRAGEPLEAIARRVLTHVGPLEEAQTFALVLARFGTRIDIYAANGRLETDGRVTFAQTASPTLPAAISLGAWDGATRDAHMSRLLRDLQGTPSESTMIALAEDFLAAGAEVSPKIGPPWHIAMLDAQGGRWQRHARRGDQWDGTNLIIQSGTLIIDGTSIRLTPATSSTFDPSHAYGFTVPSGDLALFGWDGAGVARSIQLLSRWTGGDTRSANAALAAEYAAVGAPAIASVSVDATNNLATVNLSTSQNGVFAAGQVNVLGIPNFVSTSGAAGAIAGYIRIRINGTDYRVPYFNP